MVISSIVAQVRIRAVGLNPTDWKHAFTEWGLLGAIAGSDAAGDVVAIGLAVRHIKVGDRVVAYKCVVCVRRTAEH